MWIVEFIKNANNKTKLNIVYAEYSKIITYQLI